MWSRTTVKHTVIWTHTRHDLQYAFQVITTRHEKPNVSYPTSCQKSGLTKGTNSKTHWLLHPEMLAARLATMRGAGPYSVLTLGGRQGRAGGGVRGRWGGGGYRWRGGPGARYWRWCSITLGCSGCWHPANAAYQVCEPRHWVRSRQDGWMDGWIGGWWWSKSKEQIRNSKEGNKKRVKEWRNEEVGHNLLFIKSARLNLLCCYYCIYCLILNLAHFIWCILCCRYIWRSVL